MSRIGKKPVKVPAGVKVELKQQHLKISGPQESLTLEIHPEIKVKYEGDKIKVIRPTDERRHRALHGTTRALIANMITGVTQGFRKDMQIMGAGYSVKAEGQNLSLTVGFARPVSLPIPPGVTVEIKTPATRGNEIPAEFSIRGADKYAVGQFAAQVRQARPPEPYKGKGIRYAGEYIRHKVGKAFGSGA